MKWVPATPTTCCAAGAGIGVGVVVVAAGVAVVLAQPSSRALAAKAVAKAKRRGACRIGGGVRQQERLGNGGRWPPGGLVEPLQWLERSARFRFKPGNERGDRQGYFGFRGYGSPRRRRGQLGQGRRRASSVRYFCKLQGGAGTILSLFLPFSLCVASGVGELGFLGSLATGLALAGAPNALRYR